MSGKYKFISKWSENTDIKWWNEARRELNIIITAYNQWQIDGFKEEELERLRALFEYGKQTIGSMDGGSRYFEAIEEMEEFVNFNYPVVEN